VVSSPEVTLQSIVSSLTCDSLKKSFGDVVAVDDVSFEVRPGEFFSLLGPSGCGKTTTLRLVAGFEQPDSGRILLGEEDVTATAPHRRKVNTVFQQYALFPHMKVEDNVAFGLKQAKVGKDELRSRLDQALDTVRLAELRERYPRELSGGQQQRVALARALINEPEVLLLDEPLAALDLKLRKAMQGELTNLQERVGVSFLYVTHDQGEALTLSDRIAVMNAGRVLQIGTPKEVYERPLTRFVADFIGDSNFFEGQIEDVGDAVTVSTTGGLSVRCGPTDWAERGDKVAVAVRPENVDLTTAAHNTVSGTLARVVYLGDLLQFHVRVAGHGDFVIQKQNDASSSDQWRIGEEVTVGWSEQSSLLLIDDEAATTDTEELIEWSQSEEVSVARRRA
jgi:spermidine/putrescine transport system ATP-binding protein